MAVLPPSELFTVDRRSSSALKVKLPIPITARSAAQDAGMTILTARRC
jgi:hypothetical protein